MKISRGTQIQVKVTGEEKKRFAAAAASYHVTLAAYARLAMAYIDENRPVLTIPPNEDQQQDRELTRR